MTCQKSPGRNIVEAAALGRNYGETQHVNNVIIGVNAGGSHVRYILLPRCIANTVRQFCSHSVISRQPQTRFYHLPRARPHRRQALQIETDGPFAVADIIQSLSR